MDFDFEGIGCFLLGGLALLAVVILAVCVVVVLVLVGGAGIITDTI